MTKRVRSFVRCFADGAAIMAGFVAAYRLGGDSVLVGIGGAAAVGLYGLWCFYDAASA